MTVDAVYHVKFTSGTLFDVFSCPEPGELLRYCRQEQQASQGVQV